MNFIDLVKKRSSVRGFKPVPVEQPKIDYLLEAARMAPSAVNFQPWRFYVVTDRETLNGLVSCYDREWFKTAPLCMVACGNHSESWHRKTDNKDHCDIDVAIAVEHIILAATEQGLGSCWVCNFDAQKCAELLNLPNETEPVAIIPLGYAAIEEEKPKVRKEKTDTIHFI